MVKETGKMKMFLIAVIILSMVRSFGSIAQNLVLEFLNRIDSDLIATQARGNRSGFVNPEVVQLFQKLIGIGTITLPGKKNKIDLGKTQIRIARTLPDPIAIALGIDKQSLLPANSKKQIAMLEEYRELFAKFVAEFITMQRFEYLEFIPKPPRPVLEGEPEVASWSEETHTIGG
jgi:hypothetical protein